MATCNRLLRLLCAAVLAVSLLGGASEVFAVTRAGDGCAPGIGLTGGQYCTIVTPYVYPGPVGFAKGAGKFSTTGSVISVDNCSMIPGSVTYDYLVDPKIGSADAPYKVNRTVILRWYIRIPSDMTFDLSFTNVRFQSLNIALVELGSNSSVTNGDTFSAAGGGTAKGTVAKRYDVRYWVDSSYLDVQRICRNETTGKVVGVTSKSSYYAPSSTTPVIRVKQLDGTINSGKTIIALSGTDNWGNCVNGLGDSSTTLNVPVSQVGTSFYNGSTAKLGITGSLPVQNATLGLQVGGATSITASFHNNGTSKRILCTKTNSTVLKGDLKNLSWSGSTAGSNATNPDTNANIMSPGMLIAVSTP